MDWRSEMQGFYYEEYGQEAAISFEYGKHRFKIQIIDDPEFRDTILAVANKAYEWGMSDLQELTIAIINLKREGG